MTRLGVLATFLTAPLGVLAARRPDAVGVGQNKVAYRDGISVAGMSNIRIEGCTVVTREHAPGANPLCRAFD